jgi:hypothetical protein
MDQDKFEEDFNHPTITDEDRREITVLWEQWALKVGLELPERGDIPLSRYVWKVRTLVCEHRLAHPPQEDTLAAIERCRMIVQPHGEQTGCDHEWFAVSENEAEGEGNTLAEAVAACAKAHDEIAHAVSKGK